MRDGEGSVLLFHHIVDSAWTRRVSQSLPFDYTVLMDLLTTFLLDFNNLHKPRSPCRQYHEG